MNIIDVVKTGKNFKRKDQEFFVNSYQRDIKLTKDDLLADDWETQESLVTTTAARSDQLCYENGDDVKRIKKALGF